MLNDSHELMGKMQWNKSYMRLLCQNDKGDKFQTGGNMMFCGNPVLQTHWPEIWKNKVPKYHQKKCLKRAVFSQLNQSKDGTKIHKIVSLNLFRVVVFGMHIQPARNFRSHFFHWESELESVRSLFMKPGNQEQVQQDSVPVQAGLL